MPGGYAGTPTRPQALTVSGDVEGSRMHLDQDLRKGELRAAGGQILSLRVVCARHGAADHLDSAPPALYASTWHGKCRIDEHGLEPPARALASPKIVRCRSSWRWSFHASRAWNSSSIQRDERFPRIIVAFGWVAFAKVSGAFGFRGSGQFLHIWRLWVSRSFYDNKR